MKPQQILLQDYWIMGYVFNKPENTLLSLLSFWQILEVYISDRDNTGKL